MSRERRSRRGRRGRRLRASRRCAACAPKGWRRRWPQPRTSSLWFDAAWSVETLMHLILTYARDRLGITGGGRRTEEKGRGNIPRVGNEKPGEVSEVKRLCGFSRSLCVQPRHHYPSGPLAEPPY